MNRLQSKLQYEAKQLELRKMVEVEARKLQDVFDSKTLLLSELNELAKKKAKLLVTIQNLEVKIKENNEALTNEITTQTEFIEKSHLRNRQERQQLEDKRIDFNQEIIDTRNRLENELKRRITETETVKQELDKGVKHLEEKRTVLTIR